MQLRSLRLATVVLGLVLPAAGSHAQDAIDLDDVIVTANRSETSAAASIVPAQSITRAQIERSQARSLPELLRGRAGIDIVNQGGAGKLGTLFLRGTGSGQTLILLDGVRIGAATTGMAALQDIPLDLIERIEIVRGPRSSLYGSEAIGGVIQLFTRRDTGAPALQARIGIGSHRLRDGRVGIGGALERGWFGAGLAWRDGDGIDACRGRPPDLDDPADFGAGCLVDQADRDGYRNASLNLRGGLHLTDALTLEASVLRSDAGNAYDGNAFGGNQADLTQQTLGGKLIWTPAPGRRITAMVGRADDRSSNDYRDGGRRTHVSDFDNRRDTASLQGDFDLGARHLLSAGLDWQRDAIDSNIDYPVRSRRNGAVFTEYRGDFGAHRLQLAVRHDDDSQFGGHLTGSLGWAWSPTPGWQLRASHGTGFRAPTFNDLYFPFYGNPKLKPETSRSFDLGVSLEHGRWRLALDAYQTRIDDMIGYDALSQAPANLDRARIRGIEVAASATVGGWALAVQLSHLDPRNRSAGARFDNWLPRRARNGGRLDIDRRHGRFRFGATLSASGERHDDADNLHRLPGHALFALRAEYAIGPQWSLLARVDNVFDRRYETAWWYNQPGREYGLDLRYAPPPR